MSRPLHFVDTVGLGRHVVLFCEDPEYAWRIQVRFMKKGLLKGRNCIYATYEDTQSIENKMASYGVDTEILRRKKLLHINKIPRTLKDSSKIWKSMLVGSKPPYWVVVRAIPDSGTTRVIRGQVNLEHYFHEQFLESFQGTMLCPHHVLEIEESQRAKWMVELLQNHHAAIFAPKTGQGIGFNMR